MQLAGRCRWLSQSGYFAASAIALAHAVQLRNGFYSVPALAWLSVALVCSAVGVLRTGDRGDARVPVDALLLVGIAWQLLTLLRARPGIYLHTGTLAPFRAGVCAEAVLVTLGVLGIRRFRNGWLPALIGVHGLLGGWMLWASPSPQIDVFTFTNAAFEALGGGHNPYTISFPDIYGSAAHVYGPGVVSNGLVHFGYPYPPLNLLVLAPGFALGDYRLASLAAVLASAVIIAYARPSRTSQRAAILFLTTPRMFFVLEQGWSEPVSLLMFALTIAAMAKPRAEGWIAGLLVASKQYFLVVLPLLWRHETRRGARPLHVMRAAIASGAAITLPFALWDVSAFVRDIVVWPATDPFRRDALSYLSLLARHGGADPSFVWTAVAAAFALAVALRALDGSPASFAGATAFVTFTVFTFGRKAFCNYYFFVIGALCCAIGMVSAADAD